MNNDILRQSKWEVLCNKMKRIVSFFLVVCIATFLASCGGKADNISNNKASTSDYELPMNYNLNFNSIADMVISSESIDGIKIGTSYRSLLARYGEPTSKSSDFKTTSGSTVQVWEYIDMGAEYTMIKSKNDYTIGMIKVYNKSPFSTEHDIKIGIPINNVINAYGEKINNEKSTEMRIIIGTQEKGMSFTISQGKIISITLGYAQSK